MIVKKKLTVIQALLLCVFLVCAVYLGKYFYDLNSARQTFDELRKEVTAKTPEDASGAYEEEYAEDGVLVQYDELYQKNNDFKGWIKIDGTPVDYPVVKAKDNDFYLNRDFYKKKQSSGIPFIDYECSDDGLNTIIYAHNMKDGSMFAGLSKYTDKDFFTSHTVINYDTLTERGQYEIFSVFKTTVGSKNEFKYYDYANITNEERYNEYISKVKALSMQKSDITPVFGERLLTLSTCAYNTQNERLVVVARKKNI